MSRKNILGLNWTSQTWMPYSVYRDENDLLIPTELRIEMPSVGTEANNCIPVQIWTCSNDPSPRVLLIEHKEWSTWIPEWRNRMARG